MKMEFYSELPIAKIQAERSENIRLIEQFHAQSEPYAIITWEEGDHWKTPASMQGSLYTAAKRSGRPVKISRKGNMIILEKVIKPE